VEVKGSLPWHGASADAGHRFPAHGSVAGTVMGSGQTIATSRDSTRHISGTKGMYVLTFEYEKEVGFCWVDLAPMRPHIK
jgi:hypothetical protein